MNAQTYLRFRHTFLEVDFLLAMIEDNLLNSEFADDFREIVASLIDIRMVFNDAVS